MNIYVGNLSYGMSEDELRNAFGEFGDVSSVKILMDRETGRSRGSASSRCRIRAKRKKPIAQLNGKDVGGRALRINEARGRASSSAARRSARFDAEAAARRIGTARRAASVAGGRERNFSAGRTPARASPCTR